MKQRNFNLFRATIFTVILCFVWLGGLLANSGNPKGNTEPEPGPGKGCCAYGLQLVNKFDEKGLLWVRVTGLCGTTVCCADADDWAMDAQLPTHVDFFPADGGYIPYGYAIDNDFMIYLSSESDPQTIMVEWYGLDSTVVSRQLIELSCDKDYKEDEDWTKYVTRLTPDVKELYSFIVREPEDDEELEDCGEDMQKDLVACTFEPSINCLGTNTYVVTLAGPSDFDSYSWEVVSGGSASIPSIQNPTFNLTAGGVYLVQLTAINTLTGDTCITTNDVVIPDFAPSFTTNFIPCGFQVEFTAQGLLDPSMVDEVQWSCIGHPGFPAAGTNVIYDFGGTGTFTVAMTIIDIYGCSHSVVQTVTVSTDCNASFNVEGYTLCPDCQGPADIAVTFNNTSTGGICPVMYIWNWGDGQTDTSYHYQPQVDHVYSVPNCRIKTAYNVTMTMIDSNSPIPCTDIVYGQVVIEPCNVGFDVIVCPDGKVVAVGNVPGKWTLPGAADVAPWPWSSAPNLKGQRDRVVMRLPSGTYTIYFEGQCDSGGKCTVQKTFEVVLECCAKNDADRHNELFAAGGKDYKMKYKLVQRQLPFYHKIRLKTKLKVRKSIAGIGFYKGAKADEIAASHNGTIYKSDTHCNCKIPQPVSGSDVKYNKTKVKYNDSIGGKYRSRTNTLTSEHRVLKSGVTVIKNCQLGKDCDEFCWWTDWF